MKDEGDPGYAVDFLVHEKGYVLLHNPFMDGGMIVTKSPHKILSKAQRETLYDYFIENGDHFMANQYMNDEMER